MKAPELSVIVAVAPNHPDIGPTLASLDVSCAGISVEILIVGSDHPADEYHAPGLPVRHVECAPDDLVPVRWGRGIEAALGNVVACLSTEFSVESSWASHLHAAMDRQTVGVAGAVGLATPTSPTSTAVYLLRFSAFLPRSGGVENRAEIAGDGAWYRREMVLAHPDLLAEGFWEVEFHKRWSRSNLSLRFDPTRLIRYHARPGLGSAVLLRYRHGREYGTTMVSRHRHSRMRHIAGAPVVPALLISRVVRRLGRTDLGWSMLVRSMGPLLLLTGAWALGEAVGAFRATRTPA